MDAIATKFVSLDIGQMPILFSLRSTIQILSKRWKGL
jgi:hypothetical protein